MQGKDTISKEPPKKRFNEVSTKDIEFHAFEWIQSDRNQNYESGLVLLKNKKNIEFNDLHFPNRSRYKPTLSEVLDELKIEKLYRSRQSQFESCLKHNNSDFYRTKPKPEYLIVEREPKHFTILNKVSLNYTTGEVSTRNHITDSFKQSNHRKIKALDKFCSFYQPLYENYSVSLFFVTLTSYDKYAKQNIQQFVDAMKVRFKSTGLTLLGYLWTLEVSHDNHPHYHLCIATNRLKKTRRKLPDTLKFESLWGARTKTEFVKYNVKHYLSKYFAKDNYRIQKHRSYGISKNLLLPI